MTRGIESRCLTPVRVPVGDHVLNGDLGMPAHARGLVLFAHGSGSSRHSPRNQFVSRALEQKGLATLLIDLLTPAEEAVDDRTTQFRFDLPMLSARLVGIIDWLQVNPDTASLRIGVFGASTGGGAALIAAALRPGAVRAVVSRGGRPDLAGGALTKVVAPTLLIVGEFDTAVIRLNRDAMAHMAGAVELTIVARATHLFEEPGALEQVAELAANWFGRHLQAPLTIPAPRSHETALRDACDPQTNGRG
jgi:dienelactone hydrolase